MKKIFLVFAVLFFAMNAQAQTGYAFRVKICDKNGGLTFADSLQFLTQKSLDRRSRQGFTLDSTDLPVVQRYVDSVMVKSNAVKLHNRSKWFNQVVVITYDSTKINDVLTLPFVCDAELVAQYSNYTPKTGGIPTGLSAKKFPKVNPILRKTTGSSAYYGQTYQQVSIMKADCLHDLGYWGQGMTIAVIDAGFKYSNTHTQFDSLNNSGRFLGTYNFVSDTSYVYNVNYDHGTNVMGMIIGEDPGSYVGTGPKVNMYALLTEDIRSEQPIEEDNWLSAAEWADSAGVDMINGSLGYYIFDAPHKDYIYSVDFDGNSTLIANAANMAVSKGILTVIAQGNEGAHAWHYLLTPADADSVLSVGSIDGSGAWGDSGFGPNADGQVKPDVVAIGKGAMVIGGNGVPGSANGSSFASPLMAGAVACLWQAFPAKTESEIRHLVQMVSDRYTAPNNTHGYGIPDFCWAYNIALGVDEFENEHKASTKIYPNPSNGTFSVRVKQSFLPYDFEIFDVTGKKLSSLKNIKNLNYKNSTLQNLPSGTYFIKLNSKKGSVASSINKL